MSDKPSSPSKNIIGLVGFVIIVVVAYFGGKQVGKMFAQHQNAAEVAETSESQ